MEYLIGILIGFLLAVLLGAVAAYIFLTDKTPFVPPVASIESVTGAAAITVHLIEPFLNQQLQKILTPDPAQTSAVVPTTQTLGPLKIKLNGATLKLLPESRARLTAQLTATALGINVRFSPVTEFIFLLQAGRVRILITKILLEGVNIPRHWVEGFLETHIAAAEAKLNSSLIQLQNETNVHLTAIETTPDLLTLKFT